MNKKLIVILGICLLATKTGSSQILKNILGTSNNGPFPSNEILTQNLKTDILELSQKKYDGRKLGTTGYKNVTAHIEKRMQQQGLIRYGSVGYKSTFKFPVGRSISQESKFYVDGKSLFLGKDVYPIPFSATTDISAHIIPEKNEAYAPWTMPLPNKHLTNDNLEEILSPIIINAQERGATAVYFYEQNEVLDFKKIDFKNGHINSDIKIPVWIITKKAWQDYFQKIYSITNIQSLPKFQINYDEGYNVVGLLDNKAAKTVVIMAEYDDVFPNQKDNDGANTNASGVAALLQLSQILKAPEFKKFNYAFALFSGSSQERQGVKSFLSIPNLASKLEYVIDINTIGKMNTQNEIFINGINSASYFKTAIKSASDGYLPVVGSSYPYNASYQQFIDQKIPTLSFSTGIDTNTLNNDNVAAINYNGIIQTLKLVVGVIGKLNATDANITFANTYLPVTNEDLVVKKVVVPPPTSIAKNEPSKSQKLADAKKELKSNSVAKTNPKNPNTIDTITVKNNAVVNKNQNATKNTSIVQKTAIEKPYYGAKNIVTDFLGLGINELDERNGGMVINSITAEGIGSKLGFNENDIITQIGSIPILNAKSYLYTLKRFKPGEKAYFKVKKADGKTIMIHVEFIDEKSS